MNLLISNPLFIKMKNYIIRYAGDSALAVEFENEISIKINSKVQALLKSLELKRSEIPGLLELVPSYRTLLIHYESLKIDLEDEQKTLQTDYLNKTDQLNAKQQELNNTNDDLKK